MGGHGVSGLPEGTLPVQQLLTWKESAPRGHWVMAGDICGCHTWGGAGMLLHTPQSPGGSPTEDDLAPNAISVKAEKPLRNPVMMQFKML